MPSKEGGGNHGRDEIYERINFTKLERKKTDFSSPSRYPSITNSLGEGL